MARTLRIGKIVGFHGLRGDVKVLCASGEPDWPGHLNRVELVLPERREWLKVASARLKGGAMVHMRFEGLSDRTAVEPWLHAELHADVADLPRPAENEYRVDDLLGMTVIDHQTGRIWGSVKDLLFANGSDFLEISLEGKRETVVIPFNKPFFPFVDLEKGQLHVDLLSDFLAESADSGKQG